MPSSVAEGSLEVNRFSANNSLENNNLFQWCQLELQICTLIDVPQLHVQFVTAVNYRHVNSERSSIWWRSTWSMDVGRWAAELVGTLMEFFYGGDLSDCWNLCSFYPAIYVIAGTGDSLIGTTDRRFELHSPLSLVSKKVRDRRHSHILEEHVVFEIVWQWNLFWWLDVLKPERFGQFLEEWVGVSTPLLRVTSSH